MNSSKDISFIIPAFNEQGNIVRTIDAIREFTPQDLIYEIIVIDHGSTDKTVELARRCDAQVFTVQGGTVANLRNYGAAKAQGTVYIFLDADVRLTPEWRDNIGTVLRQLQEGGRILTGSWVSVSDKNNWIEKYWFEPQQHKDNTHINSGHMIIGRKLFNELGGFNAELETGEDYDISMRAKERSINVIENRKLKVIHEGFPVTLMEFFKRECWHGKGDMSSINAFLKSKVALLATAVLALHIILLANAVIFENEKYVILSVAGILAICVMASFAKFKQAPLKSKVINTFLYYVYFLARGLSFVDIILRDKNYKRQR